VKIYGWVECDRIYQRAPALFTPLYLTLDVLFVCGFVNYLSFPYFVVLL